ncbi:leucyl aminopeptidase [Cryptosporangium arvum]|uniref:Probable cytosol aminopeptidase n=1 Tax=Cryptosporangium arvum DSM 44712 TaxID=927661 RepID=A0A010Z065_9ACTN|nr:leucyl aminopeptidase [Cryptosporangium arvum]EXG80843.1 leucyl aminopeptidase [Cryptosporangium arvum DSM 44712]
MTRPTEAAVLTVSAASAVDAEVDAVVIGVHRDGEQLGLGPGAAAVDAALGGRLLDVLARLGANGVAGEVVKVATLGATTAPIVAAVGLGPVERKPGAPDPHENYRRAAGAAIRALTGTDRVGLALVDADPSLTRPVLEGATLGAYDFVGYKSELAPSYRPPVREIVLLADATGRGEIELQGETDRVKALTDAVRTARNWINTPPNDLRPPAFAAQAAEAAADAGLEVEVLDTDALKAGGYGGILAVGLGSEAGPQLVRIAYTPAAYDKHVALVGKGITFDTGGISIKPAQNMQDMKSDMSGAACVVAAMTAIARLRPAVKVTAYVPMAENMPSGSAYRPGDVVTMYGGKKVEVLNTDAEGRMILADAIVRAVEDEPDYLLETSTLTGGQVVSLGERISGLMGSTELLARIKDAGTRTGEPMWPMPLPDEVRSGMDSAIADVTQINAGFDRAGHMLQGGSFLSRFVPDEVEWAHIDIAGPSYNTKTPHGYTPKGATGVPLRTLVEVVEDIAKNG